MSRPKRKYKEVDVIDPREFTCIQIPEGIVACKNLSSGAKLTYGVMMASMTTYARMPAMQISFPEIGEHMGISCDLVRSYITELEEQGFLLRAK